LADHAASKEQIAGAIKQLQNQDADALDPAHKKQFEEMSTQLNDQMQQVSSREQQDRAQEIDLSNQLQTEQGKLNDLSDQLNALEKKLDQQ
jgi:chromosome segregation ATPase